MQYVQRIMVMKFKSALEGDLRKQFHSISFTQRAGFDRITQLPPGQRTASTVTDTAQAIVHVFQQQQALCGFSDRRLLRNSDPQA